VSDSSLLVAGVVGVTLVMLGVTLLVVKQWWRAVAQGQALIINRTQGEPRVSRTGALVLPIVQRAELLDLSVRSVVIERRGKEGVICADGIRADVKVTFLVRVNDTDEDILRVARAVGCARAADPSTLEELFTAKFSEAIKVVAARLDFEELHARRDAFKDEILQVIGRELNGYVLDDAAIDYLEQTPVAMLDPDNILDARGIKKILASSAGIDALRHQERARVAAAAVDEAPTTDLPAELARLWLLDLRVTTEVSCDVGLGRPSLTVTLDGANVDEAARLPASVPRSVIAAVGRGELSCGGGRATMRWSQSHVSHEQLVAGARLVHSLREDEHAYR
jgi:hypothetical protein